MPRAKLSVVILEGFKVISIRDSEGRRPSVSDGSHANPTFQMMRRMERAQKNDNPPVSFFLIVI